MSILRSFAFRRPFTVRHFTPAEYVAHLVTELVLLAVVILTVTLLPWFRHHPGCQVLCYAVAPVITAVEISLWRLRRMPGRQP